MEKLSCGKWKVSIKILPFRALLCQTKTSSTSAKINLLSWPSFSNSISINAQQRMSSTGSTSGKSLVMFTGPRGIILNQTTENCHVTLIYFLYPNPNRCSTHEPNHNLTDVIKNWPVPTQGQREVIITKIKIS